MNTILWEPSKDQINSSQLEAFRLKVNNRFNLNIKNYSELHSWSISNISDFWKAIWGYMAIEFSSDYIQVVDDKTKLPGAKWFEGARFNFAENLLRVRSHKPGIHFKGEGQPVRTVTYNELFSEVEKLASALRKMGVQKGDRVAGFMPNMPETIIAMLATTSIGAIWSSSSPDFGIKGVLDRFTQIEPKVLFAANGYFYNGKAFDSLEYKFIFKEVCSENIDAFSDRIMTIENPLKPFSRYQSSKICNVTFDNVNIILSSALVVRRSTLIAVEMFDEDFGVGAKWGGSEETDLICRIIKKGGTIKYVPSLRVFHPEVSYQNTNVSEIAKKSYNYGLGRGSML